MDYGRQMISSVEFLIFDENKVNEKCLSKVKLNFR